MLRTIALTLAVAAVPALAAAQKTTYDFDKQAPFTAYRTYALKDGTPAKQQLVNDRIVSAIESQLSLKGLKRDDAAPDVVVVYHVALDKQQDISAYSTGPMYGGYGYGWGAGWGTTTTDVRVHDITIGSLAIDLVDAKQKQVVWRGLGSKEIDPGAKPDKLDKNIPKAVEKIFRNYPPKVKS